MTIYNLGNIKGEKGDKGDSITGPTGPVGVGIKSIEQITYMKFKFCLTDGSEYIINYGDEPTFDGISVSSTQDVLSYADGDSTVLSAQLTNQGQAVSVSGESVTFEVRKVSDDSLVETLTDTTDSNGEASVEYFGKGVGDLNITVRCRSVSKRYDIEDCVKTFMNTYLDQYSTGSSAVVDFDVDLPSNFKIEYETLITQSTNNSCFVSIGETSSKTLLAGKVGSTDSIWKVYARNGTDIITTGSSISTGNDWIPITLTFDGTTFKFNNDISVTNFNGVSLTKLVRISSWKERTSSGQIRNIKIKPL